VRETAFHSGKVFTHPEVELIAGLAQEIGVAAVPGSSFFREPVHNLVRLNYAKRTETLQAVGERLLRLHKINEVK